MSSTFDFFTTRTNNVDLEDASKCYTSAPSGNPVVDEVMGRLRQARTDNATGLFICAIVAALAFAILWYTVNAMISLIKDWRSNFADTQGLSNHFDQDDVLYVSDTNEDDDLPPVPLTTAVGARMAKLAIEYAGYNNAMRGYADKRDEGPPDALIDQHILSRGDDDFRYPRQRRDDRVKFRKDFVEYDNVYKGGYVGLKKPSQ